jgi:phosphate starvation-inducible PhoH-like protein
MSPVDRAAARNQRRGARRKGREHGPLLRLVEEEVSRRPIRASRQELKPLTDAQRLYDASILANRITFGVGPAGTGKTWWAAARAAEELQASRIERIIVTRPAVEAGENLGFMPGDLEEKYEPYFRPVRDALEERLGSGTVEYMLKAKIIEARPLAFLRGATLKHAWVILDEGQNTTPAQMKMFLTRIGEGATFIVNGDISQKDIEGASGLADAIRRLSDVNGISVVRFGIEDIVRDPLVGAIASRYESQY